MLEAAWSLVLLVMFWTVHQTAGEDDPCRVARYLADLPERAVGSPKSGSMKDVCDSSLFKDWYRFSGSVEGNLASISQCRTKGCATQMSVCYAEHNSDPEAGEGVVARQVCWESCSNNMTIRVKNCASFIAYELSPVGTACNAAYCIGQEICDYQTCSATGFKPCTACPAGNDLGPVNVLVTNEGVTENFDVTNTILFRCDFKIPTNSSVDTVYNINWFIDYQQPVEFVNLSTRVLHIGQLREDQWKDCPLPFWIRCAVRERLPNQLPSRFFASPRRFAGLQVSVDYEGRIVEDNILRLVKGDTKNVYVRSTVPLPYKWERGTFGGEFKLAIESSSFLEEDASHLTESAIVFPSPCEFQLDARLWNSWKPLAVTALKDMGNVGASQQRATITIRAKDNKYQFQDRLLWKNYRLPNITVILIDANHSKDVRACQSNNDPHMTTADGIQWDNHRLGEFILYQVKNPPMAVHAKYQHCQSSPGQFGLWAAASCNCGLAIRSYNTLLVIDRCVGRKADYFPYLKNEVIFQNCQDGHMYLNKTEAEYTAILASGTKVIFSLTDVIDIPYIHIYPAEDDFEKSGGLCGRVTRQLNTSDDFTLRDNSTTSSSDEFAENWRVTQEAESLFTRSWRPDHLADLPARYCFCSQSFPGRSVSDCSLTWPSIPGHLDASNPALKPFVDSCSEQSRKRRSLPNHRAWQPHLARSSPRDQRGLLEHIRRRLRRDRHEDLPPGFQYPNDGWTEESATHLCNQTFFGNPGTRLLVKVFAESTNLGWDQFLTNCIEDVQISQSSYYAPFALEGFKSVTREILERYQLWKQHFKYSDWIEIMEENDCYRQCSGRGTCKARHCSCPDGFIGLGCEITKDSAPYGLVIAQGGRCNRCHDACTRAVVLARGLPDGGKVYCRIRNVKATRSDLFDWSAEVVSEAVPSTPGQVICSFDLGRPSFPAVEAFSIRLSFNNRTPARHSVSEPVHFVVYHCRR